MAHDLRLEGFAGDAALLAELILLLVGLLDVVEEGILGKPPGLDLQAHH